MIRCGLRLHKTKSFCSLGGATLKMFRFPVSKFQSCDALGMVSHLEGVRNVGCRMRDVSHQNPKPNSEHRSLNSETLMLSNNYMKSPSTGWDRSRDIEINQRLATGNARR